MSLKLQPGPRGQWVNATAAPAPPCAPPSTVIQGGSPLLPSWSCQPPSVLRLRATAHAQPSERLREQWPTEVETNLEWLEAVTEHHPGSRKWLWNGKIVLYFENVNQECSGAPRAGKTWKRASQQEELISTEMNGQNINCALIHSSLNSFLMATMGQILLWGKVPLILESSFAVKSYRMKKWLRDLEATVYNWSPFPFNQ